MQLTHRTPLILDIDAIARDPSRITREEGVLDTLFADMRDDIRHKAGGGFTITLDAKPIAVLTHLDMGDTERHTSFAAKEIFWGLGARGVLAMRRAVKAEFAKYPGDAFVARSFSEHPCLGRWFVAIGLQPMDTGQTFIGGQHVQKVL